MVTICDLVTELKKKGIKGYSGLKKADMQLLLDGYKPFTGKEKAKPAKKAPAAKKPAPTPAPKAKPVPKEPLKLLKFTEKVNEPSSTDKPPPLSNKPLDELYVKIVSLEKRIKDDINSNEKKVVEKSLAIYKTAYKYVKKQFIDKIKKMSKAELKKLNKALEKKYNENKNKEADVVFEDQFREINKLL